jgi:uncharacterized protein
MNRAFLGLHIRALDDGARIIEGIASTPSADRVGDIVEPRGVQYRLPLPFLLDHDHSKAVGEVDSVSVGADGIRFRAHIKKISTPGSLKELCDDAWAMVQTGLRRAVSIGFRPLDAEPMRGGGMRFKAWEFLELSAVSVPANADATITATKGFSSGTIATVDPAIITRRVKLDVPVIRAPRPFTIRTVERSGR